MLETHTASSHVSNSTIAPRACACRGREWISLFVQNARDAFLLIHKDTEEEWRLRDAAPRAGDNGNWKLFTCDFSALDFYRSSEQASAGVTYSAERTIKPFSPRRQLAVARFTAYCVCTPAARALTFLLDRGHTKFRRSSKCYGGRLRAAEISRRGCVELGRFNERVIHKKVASYAVWGCESKSIFMLEK